MLTAPANFTEDLKNPQRKQYLSAELDNYANQATANINVIQLSLSTVYVHKWSPRHTATAQ